ncbi:unnamed protein product, partial [Mesorhabditis belari]|uniref:SH2 domain-containing protein n=1 Tax=Mesorhabditis belari TaxID=2138241 RepID=A0AAF3FKU0_9BILA
MDEYDDPIGSTRAQMLQQKYYHGKLTRVRAEELVRKSGEFLVRDSISAPGDYVLTTKHGDRALHFQINSTKLPTGRIVYHFEEEQFTSIPSLLQFYQSHQRPITMTSGAIIKTPIDPTGCPVAKHPESQEIEAAYARVLNPSAHVSANAHPRTLTQQAILNRVMRSRPTSEYTFSTAKEIPTHLMNRPLPVPIAVPRISNEDQDDYCDMDYDAMEDVLDASVSTQLERNGKSYSTFSLPGSTMNRGFSSCQNLTVKSFQTKNPPPLPPRSKSPNERDSALISDISDYDEPKGKESLEKNNNENDYDQVRTKMRRSENCSKPDDYDDITSRDSGINMQFAKSESILQMLDGLKKKLKQMSIDEVCKEICRQDAALIGFIDTNEKNKMENGLRQILLPSGSKMRNELNARSRSMQLVVVLTILHETKSSSTFLSFWFNIANEIFYSFGNFFAFVNIMQGLMSKVLVEQQWLWSSMDLQTRTRYERLLKAFRHLRSSGEPGESAAPCIIPLLHPVLELFTVNTTAFTDGRSFSSEIDSLWRWLEMARAWTTVADEMRDRARKRFELSKKNFDITKGLLSHSILIQIFTDSSNCDSEKKYYPALSTIEYLLQNVRV